MFKECLRSVLSPPAIVPTIVHARHFPPNGSVIFWRGWHAEHVSKKSFAPDQTQRVSPCGVRDGARWKRRSFWGLIVPCQRASGPKPPLSRSVCSGPWSCPRPRARCLPIHTRTYTPAKCSQLTHIVRRTVDCSLSFAIPTDSVTREIFCLKGDHLFLLEQSTLGRETLGPAHATLAFSLGSPLDSASRATITSPSTTTTITF